MPSTVESLVHALASAHRTGRLANASELDALNVSTAEAYAAQAGVAIALDDGVAGWKAGFGPDKSSVAAPLLASVVKRSGATVPLPPDRPMILEIEIAFRLARDLPPRPGRPYTPGEIEDAIDVVLAGAELIAPRGGLPSSGTPFPRFVADLQGNAGYVCGGETRGFSAMDLKACRVELWIDDERVHDAVGGHPQGDPWLPLVAWASAQQDRLGGLKRGQVVTTGSLTPPRPISHPCRVRATVEGVGDVSLTLAAARR
jgi:2-keto-4-pentenoate hydratase